MCTHQHARCAAVCTHAAWGRCSSSGGRRVGRAARTSGGRHAARRPRTTPPQRSPGGRSTAVRSWRVLSRLSAAASLAAPHLKHQHPRARAHAPPHPPHHPHTRPTNTRRRAPATRGEQLRPRRHHGEARTPPCLLLLLLLLLRRGVLLCVCCCSCVCVCVYVCARATRGVASARMYGIRPPHHVRTGFTLRGGMRCNYLFTHTMQVRRLLLVLNVPSSCCRRLKPVSGPWRASICPCACGCAVCVWLTCCGLVHVGRRRRRRRRRCLWRLLRMGRATRHSGAGVAGRTATCGHTTCHS